MAKVKIEREYESRGVSAHPKWWSEVEAVSGEMGLNRSAFIRMAVNEFLKDAGVDTPKQQKPVAA